jgi:lysophospholipase L1-like esterase
VRTFSQRRSSPAVWLLLPVLLVASLVLLLTVRPPQPVVDSSADREGLLMEAERLREATDEPIRLRLSGPQLALLVRDVLNDDARLAVDGLTISVREAGPAEASLHVRGTLSGSRLPLRADLLLSRDGSGVDVAVLETRVAGVPLPNSAEAALDDVLDDAADLGGLLDDVGLEVREIGVEDGDLVLGGRAEDPEGVATRLRAAARSRGGVDAGRDAPEERLGRGRARGDVDGAGDVVGYLALGDSITAATGVADPRDGFASRLHAALEDRHGEPSGYHNLAQPGETARSLVTDGQLDRALATLERHDVGLVTLTVGSNELLGLLEDPPCAEDLASPRCVAAVDRTVSRFADDLDTVLATLREAGPDARIVVVGAYSPFSFGTGSDFERRAEDAVSQLDATAAQTTRRHGVAWAEAQSAFVGRADALTLMAQDPPDIHPSPLGHDVLAAAVLDAVEGDR